MNIYVGNLNPQTTQKQLESIFTPFGTLSSVKIIKEDHSGNSRGYGFVEMPNQNEAKQAIAELDSYNMDEHIIVVSKARQNNG